ncbi:HNH endonuclease family protein [Streptomyces sp. SRF1]|uniref:HNH endonuclease family protein n=1 Tax=Streptomyces sp. SRF1 TaxID=1549642 RepID=UPI0025AF32D2|nr:HNH endonuclease family protein [Streptomyces sp. SRF1]MDN3058960.1 HNH endonuclease family protein [Streptomyces sp. SRF1]
MRLHIRSIVLTLATAVAALAGTVAPASAAPSQTVTTTLREAIHTLPVAAEDRTGYQRTAFKHWVDADTDGCNTRAEVLISEAIEPPTVSGRCTLSGGIWHSYYDNADVQDARGLDIDHMVPLAEAWDSGASTWSAQERQDYANDLGDIRSLAAVSARENRSKADQDPNEWLPSDPGARCRYIEEWTVVKARWGLSADPREVTALTNLADSCRDTRITYTPTR